jgi:hypothetical protein
MAWRRCPAEARCPSAASAAAIVRRGPRCQRALEAGQPPRDLLPLTGQSSCDWTGSCARRYLLRAHRPRGLFATAMLIGRLAPNRTTAARPSPDYLRARSSYSARSRARLFFCVKRPVNGCLWRSTAQRLPSVLSSGRGNMFPTSVDVKIE